MGNGSCGGLFLYIPLKIYEIVIKPIATALGFKVSSKPKDTPGGRT